MTNAQQPFVTDPNGKLGEAYIGTDHADWPLIVAALKAHYSDTRPKWMHPFKGRFESFAVAKAEPMALTGENGYAFTLYNGGSGKFSNTWVQLTPARRCGFGPRYFKVKDVTNKSI